MDFPLCRKNRPVLRTAVHMIGISQTLPLLWQNLSWQRFASRRKCPYLPSKDFSLSSYNILAVCKQVKKTIPIHVPWKIVTYPLPFLRISLPFLVSHKPRSLLCRAEALPSQPKLCSGTDRTFLTFIAFLTSCQQPPPHSLNKPFLDSHWHTIHVLANSQAQPLCPHSIHLRLRLNLQ